jgi:hypothetical protein
LKSVKARETNLIKLMHYQKSCPGLALKPAFDCFLDRAWDRYLALRISVNGGPVYFEMRGKTRRPASLAK